MLYTGVTSDLLKRVGEHKLHIFKGFTSWYGVSILVHFESTSDVESAIKREKQIKKWNREWKIRLIESMNPEWRDLYCNFIDECSP